MSLELRNFTPFAAAVLPWESKPGQPSLSVCVKGTFEITRGEELGVAGGLQEPIHGEDEANPSPRHASDQVPFKPRVDLLLVGSLQVESPLGALSTSATVRLGAFEKTLRATSSRPFRRAALVYENAVASSPDATVLQATDPSHAPSFGPLGLRWPARMLLNPEPAWRWAEEVLAGRGWEAGPPPPGFDFASFNSAPREQQLEMIRPSASLELEGLLPGRPVASLRLPSTRPQVFRVGSGRTAEVVLRLDTVIVDLDRGLVCLSWRGVATPILPHEGGVLVLLWDASGKKLRPENALAALTGGGPSSDSGAQDADPLGERHDRKLADPDALPPPPTRTLSMVAPEQIVSQIVSPLAALPRVLPTASASAPAPSALRIPAPPHPEPVGVGAPASQGYPPGEAPVDEASTAQDTRPIRKPPGTLVSAGSPAPVPPPRPTPPRAHRDEITGEIALAELTRPATPFAERAHEETFDDWASVKDAEITQGELEPNDGSDEWTGVTSTTQDVPGEVDLGPAAVRRASAPRELTTAASMSLHDIPPPPPPEVYGARPHRRTAPIVTDEPSPESETFDDGREIELEECATLAARLGLKGALRDAVLRDAKLSAERWAEIEKRWQASISEETAKGQSKLLRRYDEAYLAEQAKLRGRPIELEEYAELVVASERGQALKALASHGLVMSDMMRLQRVWTRRSAEDAKLAERIRKTVEVARSA